MLRRVYDLAQATTFPGTKGIDEETRERAEGISPEAELAFRNAGIGARLLLPLFRPRRL